MAALLHEGFEHAARRDPDRIAVVEPGVGRISYGALAALSDRLRDYLRSVGVRHGDRVGIYLPKSIDAVAAIYGILKAGAAYVPVDPGAPATRNAFIMQNCGVAALIVDRRFVDAFRAAFEAADGKRVPPLLCLDSRPAGAGLNEALRGAPADSLPAPPAASAPDDLAYILYTSGSTGKPKGVMLSHENAVSFVDWCSETFEPTSDDRFSSHAPFHFDLSILDIHVAFKHGATLVLIGEDIGKDPANLAKLIATERISCWYSAPSILSLLAQYGDLAQNDYGALRMVLFAGEVFPIKHLRRLMELVPHPRYFNLYGPTETNVCTYYEVPNPLPPAQTVPCPIGKVCSHLEGRVVDDIGQPVAPGGEGELCIAGRGVMQGYWGLQEQTARAFLSDDARGRWYKTGDIVVEQPDGGYVYRGRRDRMVKRRGYRVELGEIEAGLYRHPQIKEVAVVARADEEAGVRITAFMSAREGKPPGLIELKRFCAEHLPLYMIPDKFTWCDALPKTSTDKVDYQRLKDQA